MMSVCSSCYMYSVSTVVSLCLVSSTGQHHQALHCTAQPLLIPSTKGCPVPVQPFCWHSDEAHRADSATLGSSGTQCPGATENSKNDLQYHESVHMHCIMYIVFCSSHFQCAPSVEGLSMKELKNSLKKESCYTTILTTARIRGVEAIRLMTPAQHCDEAEVSNIIPITCAILLLLLLLLLLTLLSC